MRFTALSGDLHTQITNPRNTCPKDTCNSCQLVSYTSSLKIHIQMYVPAPTHNSLYHTSFGLMSHTKHKHHPTHCSSLRLLTDAHLRDTLTTRAAGEGGHLLSMITFQIPLKNTGQYLIRSTVSCLQFTYTCTFHIYVCMYICTIPYP